MRADLSRFDSKELRDHLMNEWRQRKLAKNQSYVQSGNDMVVCKEGLENPKLVAGLTGFHPVRLFARMINTTSALTTSISTNGLLNSAGLSIPSGNTVVIRKIWVQTWANDSSKQLGFIAGVHVHADATNGITDCKWEDYGRSNEARSFEIEFKGEGNISYANSTANILSVFSNFNHDMVLWAEVLTFI